MYKIWKFIYLRSLLVIFFSLELYQYQFLFIICEQQKQLERDLLSNLYKREKKDFESINNYLQQTYNTIIDLNYFKTQFKYISKLLSI